jgi:hypothetical protein
MNKKDVLTVEEVSKETRLLQKRHSEQEIITVAELCSATNALNSATFNARQFISQKQA